MNPTILSVTKRIMDRSKDYRKDYLGRMQKAAKVGPRRQHLSCGNQAPAYAAIVKDRNDLALGEAATLGIVTAYNDILSAHQPFERFPNIIRAAARKAGCTCLLYTSDAADE